MQPIPTEQGKIETGKAWGAKPHAASMNIEDTLTRVRRKDMQTLAQIHDRYYPDVYRYVRYRLSDEDGAQDIASEVFYRLLDALHKDRGPQQNLRGWLLGTAANLVNDHYRSHYHRQVDNLEEDVELAAPDNLEHAFERQWQSLQLQQAIQQLTPEQQHVLALRFVEEYSLEETAAQMERTVNAIKQLQFRAIASLKRILETRSQ
jgi:RNA polymerase sigma-70 factor (ECF subfamily)